MLTRLIVELSFARSNASKCFVREACTVNVELVSNSGADKGGDLGRIEQKQTQRGHSQRNQSLDVLRCIAVLLVLGVHDPYYHFWWRTGWIGVDLFFVLSGFLISGLLFKDYQAHGSIDWRRFLVRRGFKIYPSYYVLLGVTGLLLSLDARNGQWFGRVNDFGHIIRVSAAFLTNYRREALVPPFGHLWSVAVEEHFYVLLPGMLILLAKRRTRDPFAWVLILFPLTAFLCLALRCFTVPRWQIVDATHLRIDSLFAGVALGYLYHFRRGWFDRLAGTRWSLVAAGVFCSPALFLAENTRKMQTVGLTSLYIGFALLVAWSINRSPRGRVAGAIFKAAASVGFYSYSIYLWHDLLSMFITSWANSAIPFWSYIFMSIALGIVMSKAIEMPALALRDRLFPAATAPPAASIPGQMVAAPDSTRY